MKLFGVKVSLDQCTTNSAILNNEAQLRNVRDRIQAYQMLYGRELEKYTFDDDGTGQTEVRRLESELQELMKEEFEIKMTIRRLRILEKIMKDQASKRHGQTI